MRALRPAVAAATAMSLVLVAVAVLHVVAFAAAYDSAHSFAAWNLDIVAFALEIAVPLSFGAVGALLVALRPRNPIGWLFSAAAILLALGGYFPGIPWREGGLLDVVSTLDWQWKQLVVFGQAIDMPLSFLWGGAANVAGWTIVVGALVLVFPTGRLPSRWWAALAIPVVVVGAVVALSHIPYTLPGRDLLFSWLRYRLEVAGNRVGLDDAAWAVAGALAALVVILRYRRSGTEERMQLKWFVAAAALLAVVVVTWVGLHLAGAPFSNATWRAAANIAFGVALLLLPLATAAAVLKYRLYDIELVLERSMVFGASALFIAGGYVVAVLVAGEALGSGGGSEAASALAMTVTAVAFQPARGTLERAARSVVYGRRADPYAVLARLASDVADVLTPDEVMPSVAAATVAVAGGAAQVRLDLDGGETVAHTSTDAATWQRLGAIGGGSLTEPVKGSAGIIGAIEVRTTRGQTLTDGDRARVRDLAAEAGLALEQVRLIEGLQRRLVTIRAQADELAASHERLLGAETWARLSIARELRDVVDLRLTAAARAIDQAATAVESNVEAAALITLAAEEASRALEETRDVARGVFPAVLDEAGLVAALKARIRHAEWPVQVEAAALENLRFEPMVESALHFCATEALRDLVHAGHTATLRIDVPEGGVEVIVTGGTTGSFTLPPAVLQQMSDRMGAVGGSVEVRQGTDVRPLVRASVQARAVPEHQERRQQAAN